MWARTEEDAIVKTYNKLYSNFDRIPPGVSQPIIKLRSIDDVPILALTLWGKNYDAYQLRRIAGELEHSLKQLDDVSETTIIGGQPRKVRVILDTQRLAAYGLTPRYPWSRSSAPRILAPRPATLRAITGNFRWRLATSSPDRKNCNKSWWEFTRAVPVYLRDVVEKIEDGPAEPDSYVLFANAQGTTGRAANPEFPAVTITAGQAQRRERHAAFPRAFCTRSIPFAATRCPTI